MNRQKVMIIPHLDLWSRRYKEVATGQVYECKFRQEKQDKLDRVGLFYFATS
jgi:hypothetical protein